MSNTHKVITIVDPERWGLKFNEKRQWYYKIRLDFLNDSLVQSMENTTKLVFLTIIFEALRENKHQISMCLDFIKHQLRVEQGVIKGSLRELKVNNIIELETNVRIQLIEENRIEENRIEQNKKTTSESAHKSNSQNHEVLNTAINYNKQFLELFKQHQDISQWIINAKVNCSSMQKKLLDEYLESDIVEQTIHAYQWQLENNKKRTAGKFIYDWLKRSSCIPHVKEAADMDALLRKMGCI